jgi:hypothetical protein
MRTKLAKIAFTAALALATAFTLSCSGDDKSPGNNPAGGESEAKITKSKISGVSQKGPFVEGSTATLYELDGDFNQTGRSFRDIIADNKGSFEIRGVELISPYAMLEASGYYRNEVTGELSKSPITLFAIADLREKDNVNVNILTHLEYYRVLNLVENSGKSVAEAKKQAQREILAVFGIDSDGFKNSEDMSIFGTSEGDAALLAISVLLQGDLGEGEFSQRLTNFAQGIKENGAWNDEDEKQKTVDWAWGADLDNIKNNILDWQLSSEVSNFGKYVYGYWTAHYGLERCDASNEGDVKNYWVCKNSVWKHSSDIDRYCFEYFCGVFIDIRDNENYKTIEIDVLIFMIEPLRYSDGKIKFNDGNVTLCPDDWRLPSEYEADIFINVMREKNLSFYNFQHEGRIPYYGAYYCVKANENYIHNLQ